MTDFENFAVDAQLRNSVELPRGELLWSAYCYDVLVMVDAYFELRLVP